MSPALVRWADSGFQIWGFLILVGLHLAMDRWWKGSPVANVVQYVYLSYVPLWFLVKARVGYLRRKPHWTRESWLRFLRLMAWPVGALIVLFAIMFAFESSRSMFGAPQSGLRVLWILVMLTLMGMGAGGLPIAIGWLAEGEPSKQFTRTRWMQWRAPQGV